MELTPAPSVPPSKGQLYLNKFKSHKKLSITICVVLVAGIGFWIYKSNTSSATTLSYVTGTITRGTVTTAVSGTGQVVAAQNVDMTAGAAGKVTSVNVAQGQVVKAGDTIATLDSSAASTQLAQTRASVESAQAAYDKLIAGNTDTVERDQLSVQTAQQNLQNAQDSYTQTGTDQDRDIAKAQSTLYNSNLSAVPNDNNSSGSIAISGTYTGAQQGSYIISMYQAGDGVHFTVSGLGSGQGVVNRGLAQPIGNGLYITFSSSGTFSAGTTWTINLPNTSATSYLSNLQAYNDAVANKPEALKTAQQQIDSAQNSLTQAQLQLSQDQQPPTQADVDSAKASILTAQANLASAVTNYDNTIIKAPFDGIISKVDAQVGNQLGSGGAVASIVANNDLAQITLNEADAAKVKVGQKVTMTFSALPNLTLTGTVATVDTVGTVSQNVVNFTVQISFDAQNDQVKPGMSVTANIITAADQDVLVVPSSAVKTDSSGQSYLQQLVNGKPQQLPVTIGLSSNTQTEVSGDNISEGESIITQTISTAKTTSAAASGSLLQSLSGGRGAAGGNATFIQSTGGFGAGAAGRTGAAGGAARGN